MIILSIICILLILFILIYIIKTEKYDLMCPCGPLTKNKSLCREGNGKTYSGSKSTNKDKIKIILDKIDIAGNAYINDVTWRKYFIGACFSCFLLFLIIMRKIPSIDELIGSILVIFISPWALSNLYNYHHYKHIQNNILESTNIIRKRFINKSLHIIKSKK